VLEGTITIVIDKEKYHAKKGESFYIACDKPHYLENRTSHLAKAIWISSPPMF
jgi:mannose-6-phosphate isomerase-like protein (cupin superfamily)